MKKYTKDKIKGDKNNLTYIFVYLWPLWTHHRLKFVSACQPVASDSQRAHSDNVNNMKMITCVRWAELTGTG